MLKVVWFMDGIDTLLFHMSRNSGALQVQWPILRVKVGMNVIGIPVFSHAKGRGAVKRPSTYAACQGKARV